jgi:hypothetical protein
VSATGVANVLLMCLLCVGITWYVALDTCRQQVLPRFVCCVLCVLCIVFEYYVLRVLCVLCIVFEYSVSKET